MSKSRYPVQYPRSLPALFVRLKESRFKLRFDRPLIHDFRHALGDPRKHRIWLYWAQGWDNAPYIVKRCAQSWSALNPDWIIEKLDDTRLSQFISLDGVPSDINKTKQSNVWRLRLLERYGGIWVDATVFCTQPLSDWLPMLVAPTRNFFFKMPTPNRPFSSWFIASLGNSYIIWRFRQTYERYLNQYGDQHTFALHFIFQYLIIFDRRFANEYKSMPSVSAIPALEYGRWYADPQHWPKPNISEVPMHKLSWKHSIDISDLEALISQNSS